MPLIPQIVDAARGKKNFLGSPVLCVAAGGIFDGRGLAASLALGASGVWVGTRFICSTESAAPKSHQEKVLKAGSNDTIRSLAISGRPLRLIPNDWINKWEADPGEMQRLCDQGITPLAHDAKSNPEDKEIRKGIWDVVNSLAGQASGGVKSVEPAQKIVEDMVSEAVAML